MSADGKWKIVVHTPMGPRETELEIAVQGEAFTGTASTGGASNPVQGKADGDRLTWTANITSPMPLTLEFDVTFSGDTAEGKVKLGMLGDAKVTGGRA